MSRTHGPTAQWLQAARNSLFIGLCATMAATILGTVAALGLSRADLPFRRSIMAILLSPMIVPIIITSASLYFFFSKIGLSNTYLGHHPRRTRCLACLSWSSPSRRPCPTIDRALTRAAASLGAGPITSFRRIMLPLIFPGMASGALFAFIASFDEVVAVIFLAAPEQRTIPRQMWSGIREQISPTILAVATILVLMSMALLGFLETLRRRSTRMGRDGN